VREVGEQALILEAHHTTHIEGTRLTLDQAERLWKGEAVPEADPDDTRELLNYGNAFEFVSECLDSGIAQFQLVHIHPFLDGNGRASRLLSTLCLYKAGYDFKRLFSISEYYDRDRPDPPLRFGRAMTSCDTELWRSYDKSCDILGANLRSDLGVGLATSSRHGLRHALAQRSSTDQVTDQVGSTPFRNWLYGYRRSD